jgi:hypothetical protein
MPTSVDPVTIAISELLEEKVTRLVTSRPSAVA